ncbi:HD domain-containing phosphohydrolase [Clostridium sp. JN-9]|uniref:HD-GYP domain-containing protein n=1 Tax=Clostridium sp. JN-9 TaxID=2507159 RepID=UPI000FFE2A7F|nr:HD domain-containing phosphohydrolase [Clostridium sp. JN-9]QAT41294.1 HD domain-containing protein [Clostridium sp. JN-9]
MLLNLNEFLTSVSFALDFVEMDILGMTSNHGKRTAYISIKIAEQLNFGTDELKDISALAILHDNGISYSGLGDDLSNMDSQNLDMFEKNKWHCIVGEKNIITYPFNTNVTNVIKYHHEKYDGTGFFKLKGNEIPLMSQIIALADRIESRFDIKNNELNMQKDILSFAESKKEKDFSSKIVDAFLRVTENKKFWEDLKDPCINTVLRESLPDNTLDLTFNQIHEITKVFSEIIDSKSRYTRRHSKDLSIKAGIMADFYKYKPEEKMKLIIAADLHDIGKLAVPNTILDSPNKLSDGEFQVVKKHPYYTRVVLEQIKGFEEITNWAANHHEKLNGMGYPYGLTAKDLDFNSRLMGCLDIYEALTEERPYRKSLSHKEAMDILYDMSHNGFVDESITKDIDKALI